MSLPSLDTVGPNGSSSPTNPIVTEIIRNAFLSAAEDMRAALWRSAFSPVIYEMKDCSVALFDAQARLLAQAPGLPFFLGALGEVIQVVIDHVGLHNFGAGDVYILNDPYLTGSHLNDVDILSPVLYEDKLVGFTITRAHWLDIGSKDAAYAVDSREIYQEGLRLGPVKLVDAGKVDKDIVDILARNSRLPHSLVGDMHAQIAACRLGERRFIEVLDKYGLDAVHSAMNAVFDMTEQLERETIESLPDGVYEAAGYQDNDFQSADPIPVHVKVTIRGSDMTVDTSGSSLQRPGCTNCGLVQTISAVRLAYKFLIRPDLGVTGGSFRSLAIEVEPGSIFAAEEPAACLQYGSHTMLLVDLIQKALAPVMPERVTAGLPGDAWNVIIIGPHPKQPGLFMCLESTAGGWGASLHNDGDSGVVHFAAGDFKNLPVETLENKYPLLIRQYALGTDTGGPGRSRGGLNIVRDYELLTTNSRLSLWFERSLTPQWGLFGGQHGAVPRVLLYPGTSHEEALLKVNHRPVAAGTVVRAFTGGGGGYGPPWQRDPERVREDVIEGYVSLQAAANDYGVYLRGEGLEIDLEQTRWARERMAQGDMP